jgi:quercetin dioxygenase-like cupin family protein
MKKLAAGLFAVTMLAGTVAFAVDSALVVSPSDLKWQPSRDIPGAQVALISGDPSKQELFTARIKLPANFKILAHTHPTNEYDTIISGALFTGEGSQFSTNDLQKISAGSVVVFPAGVEHFSMTKQPTVVQITGVGPWGINYLNSQNGQNSQDSQSTQNSQ